VRPDTKRTHFQPSLRHDEVVRSLRRFYSSTALRARAWSEQVVIEDKCDEIQAHSHEIQSMLAEMAATPGLDRTRDIQEGLSQLVKATVRVSSARKEAVRTDSSQEAESRIVSRSYLRKTEVMQALDAALGTSTAIRKLVDAKIPKASLQPETSAPPSSKRG